jgi:hypothetical protein
VRVRIGVSITCAHVHESIRCARFVSFRRRNTVTRIRNPSAPENGELVLFAEKFS